MDIVGNLKGTVWPRGKKGLGAPIYVEEDGPVLGIVDDVFVDRASGRPMAYRVQTSGQFIELPAESVEETPAGFVYRSPWLTEADAVVRKLDSQELLMPELLFSSITTKESDRKILERAMEHSPALKTLVGEARDLYHDLVPRIQAMERERAKVVGQVAELTEGVASGRLDKGAYREGFVALKRRLQLLEATIRRAESLRTRLERAPFVQVALNGTAPTESGAARTEKAGPVFQAPGHSDEWKRIKKFRVLKAEKDLAAREARVKQMEKEMSGGGVPVNALVEALSRDFDQIAQARAAGPEALRKELERRLGVSPAAPSRSSGSSEPDAPAMSRAPTTEELLASLEELGAGKVCPLCSEPLKGTETSCPSCHADLSSIAPSGKRGEQPPGRVDKFFKGGGATKTGVVLLIAAAAIFVLRMFAH